MKKYGLILILALMLAVASFSTASASPNLQGGNVHYVSYGETLYSIAARYGVPIDAIMQVNGLFNPDMIYVGQPLRIPGGYGYGPGPGCGNQYRVMPGDTLSGIAYRFGVPMPEVMAYNNMANRDMVYVGQTLCLPGGPPRPVQPVGYGRPPADGSYHIVARGESLHMICDRYGVPYQAVMRANQLPNPNIIVPGQRLFLPGYHPGPASLPPPVEEVISPHGPPPAYHPDDVPVPPPPVLPPIAPPPAPHYGGGKDKAAEVPPAPAYDPKPAKALLPTANHPIEVVVNGGAVWTGEAFPNFPDPNGDTVLIVSTRETDKPTVRLRSGDYEVKGTLGKVPEFGVDKFRFAFRYIPPGDYDVWFDDPEGIPSEKIPVTVEAGKRVEVEFHKGVGFSGPTYASPDGWVLGDWKNPSKPGENIGGWSNILVRTPASGLNVNIESEGSGYKAQCFTGTKGPGACDFAGLNAGIYYIWIDGTDLTLKTYMDGAAYAEFEFIRQPTKSSEDVIGPVSYSN